MSNEENAKKTVDAAKETGGKLLSSMMDLKEKSPKVFFGVVGGVVFLLLVIIMSGGDSGTISGPSAKNLVAGQRYVLKNPNTYEIESPIKLLPVPGSMAAFDDSEEEGKGKVESCRRIAQGTPVIIIGFQDFAGKKNAFANVQVDDGQCKGSTGWVSAIDVQ
ncbi:hypothetical protein [Methylobacter svalbardensis]|uniref:hypothetical protein n=1 Tax=Methylobacter svalbardensis TaxID=3080016 RepID=UPI0030EE1253